MSNELHVVLGASGAIGGAVIIALRDKGKNIKAVERTKKVIGVDTVLADLLDKEQAFDAIRGATHVYLCVGLPYNSSIWQRDWPKLMESVIEACSKQKAKLIFFDNIYMYGPAPLSVPFAENESQQTTTIKGLARKKLSDLVLKAHNLKKIDAVIGRSADFYGPGAINSSLYIKFIENVLAGKNPQVISKPGSKHTYAYTLDNGRALVDLALDESSYGQVWHLPVGKPVTIEEITDILNRILEKNFKVSYLPRPLLNIISIFMPILKEAKEMLYQFDNNYIMSDKKFRIRYPNFKTTSYEEGLKAMIESFQDKKDK